MPAFSQSTMQGYYTVKTFTTKDYRFHPRNFYISEDSRGLIYVANAYGVMEYDGVKWKNIGLVNSESALCIVPAPDGTQYVGANREAGYLFVDATGEKKYHSLSDKMPADQSSIGSVDDIFSSDNDLFFCGGSSALVYKNNSFNWLAYEGKKLQYSYAGKSGNKIYFQQKEKGLLEYKQGRLLPVPFGHLLKGLDIVELIVQDTGQLLVISHQGLFRFHGSSLQPWSASSKVLDNHRLSHATRLSGGHVVITTHDAGAFILDKDGVLQKHLSDANGLPDNNINYAYCDQRGNLWLALDNGVAYVEINTAFSFLERASGLAGMGMAAAVFEDRLYLGTSQGLYYSEWNDRVHEDVFKPVKGISGQVWSLTVTNGLLICNQVSRLYTIKADKATPVFTEFPDKGNWKTLVLQQHPGYALVGTYTGLQLYKLEQGTIRYFGKLKGFEEACRTFVEAADGSIWVAHGNRGLYRLFLDETLQAVKAENHSIKNGFKPDFFNHINFLDGQLVFASDEGPYTYDVLTNRIIYNKKIAGYFGADYLNKFYQFENQNMLLFKNGTDIIWLRKKNKVYQSEKFLLKKLHRTAVGSYEFAAQVSEKHIIMGTEHGFVLFNTEFKALQKDSFQVLLRSIVAPFHNDRVLFSGNFTTRQTQVFEFPYALNSIRLSYASNYYESTDKTSYQYAWVQNNNPLIWSSWNSNTSIDLTGLREGNYTLHVRARNVYGSLSEEALYRFRILPPWYRSLWAYAVYGVLICVAAYFLFLWIKNRFKKQRFELEQKHLIKLLQKDKELSRLQTEALQEKLTIQNNELTSMAALLNQRSELLSLLNEKVRSFEAQHPNTDPNLVRELVHAVHQQSGMDATWSNFQTEFDYMHQNFLKRFKEKYPRLDESWLLLCAYIRMNKSYKEISNQLHISVAAVDKRLYRLKDKLELAADVKIREYIQNF